MEHPRRVRAFVLSRNSQLHSSSARDPRKILKHLAGGTMIVLVWIALWAWLAAGVVRPLSTVPSLRASVAAQRA